MNTNKGKHYLYLEMKTRTDLLDTDVMPSDYEATCKASSVALHYMSANTDYPEFRAILEQGRAAHKDYRASE